MNQNFEVFKTTMPRSRKADYYLGCLDSSVFIDFNTSTDNLISLERISFDGYGCCNLDGKGEFLDKKDSTLFIEEINKENLNQKAIANLIIKAIRINKGHIWNDALEEYGLLEKE